MHVVRRAVPADADALATLGARTFVESFGHLYSQEDLQAFLEQSHTPQAYAKLLGDAAYALWLAHDTAGEAIGYALAGPSGLPHADVKPGDGELKRLYLRADCQGSGTGARLFEQALEWLEREGPRTIWISVWSENFGAQRFYGRYGFEKAGEYEFIVGQQRDHEFIYRRDARTA
ncbi:GNAT family N-acetyltransferase [Agrilutibacter solisilvae]|uniref:GNAT family N-acetyltransferase n=1 Tax=Agrilutibacter solisilvae TaxID=2763317 RepID=A0A974Y0V0_9GAMM|nr:N-acetyltransferase [Lysobacter solisilvae]QSX78515.1 GNAT family N-acetyltransferase [Lysobacter solisilvae]